MNKSKLEAEIRKQAGNFLYTFIDEKEAERYPAIIQRKRLGQIKYLKALATSTTGVNTDDIYGWIKSELANVYKPIDGKTASGRGILYKMAYGQPAQGKYYRGGSKMSGIGATPVNSITVDGNAYTLNPDTGIFTNETKGYQLKTSPIYDNNELSNAFAQDANSGVCLTSNYDELNKKFSLAGTGNSAGDLTWTQTAMNICQNVQTMLPYITNLVTSLATMLSGVNPQQITVNEVADGWVDNQSGSLISSASVSPWLLAGLVLGGVYLTSKDKKGARR